jgi:hypothetical protein
MEEDVRKLKRVRLLFVVICVYMDYLTRDVLQKLKKMRLAFSASIECFGNCKFNFVTEYDRLEQSVLHTMAEAKKNLVKLLEEDRDIIDGHCECLCAFEYAVRPHHSTFICDYMSTQLRITRPRRVKIRERRRMRRMRRRMMLRAVRALRMMLRAVRVALRAVRVALEPLRRAEAALRREIGRPCSAM